MNDGRQARQCAKRYPSKSAIWKKTRKGDPDSSRPAENGKQLAGSDRFHQKKQKRGQKHDTEQRETAAGSIACYF